jgi:hypothetical protein
MKVKIGNTWYDATVEPICLRLSQKERDQIGRMDPDVATEGKYAQFPDDDTMTHNERMEWMGG